jgi:hypothetical protein
MIRVLGIVRWYQSIDGVTYIIPRIFTRTLQMDIQHL